MLEEKMVSVDSVLRVKEKKDLTHWPALKKRFNKIIYFSSIPVFLSCLLFLLPDSFLNFIPIIMIGCFFISFGLISLKLKITRYDRHFITNPKKVKQWVMFYIAFGISIFGLVFYLILT